MLDHARETVVMVRAKARSDPDRDRKLVLSLFCWSRLWERPLRGYAEKNKLVCLRFPESRSWECGIV